MFSWPASVLSCWLLYTIPLYKWTIICFNEYSGCVSGVCYYEQDSHKHPRWTHSVNTYFSFLKIHIGKWIKKKVWNYIHSHSNWLCLYCWIITDCDNVIIIMIFFFLTHIFYFFLQWTCIFFIRKKVLKR